MSTVSRESAPDVTDYGPAEDRGGHLDGHVVIFTSIHEDWDLTPVLKGLPGGGGNRHAGAHDAEGELELNAAASSPTWSAPSTTWRVWSGSRTGSPSTSTTTTSGCR
jgi:hypothetical protein